MNIPPRREPRVLALARSRGQLLWVVVDPYEVRAAGDISVGTGTTSLTTVVRRLIRREKPTLVATPKLAVALDVRRITDARGLPLVSGCMPPLPVEVATDMFPELPLHCPSPRLTRLAAYAIAVTLHAPHQPRRYAKTLRQRAAVRAA
ncbi:MAG: hypothetical protein ACHREM_09415 [Polyangiales bacterium]